MQLHSDSCLTKSELGRTPGLHFLVTFRKLILFFQRNFLNVYLLKASNENLLTPLFLPVLLGTQVQWLRIANGNVLANVGTVAGWRKKQGWSRSIPWLNSSVSSSTKCSLIPYPQDGLWASLVTPSAFWACFPHKPRLWMHEWMNDQKNKWPVLGTSNLNFILLKVLWKSATANVGQTEFTGMRGCR